MGRMKMPAKGQKFFYGKYNLKKKNSVPDVKVQHYFEIAKCYLQILASEFQARIHRLPAVLITDSSNSVFYLSLSIDHSVMFYIVLTLNSIQHLVC